MISRPRQAGLAASIAAFVLALSPVAVSAAVAADSVRPAERLPLVIRGKGKVHHFRVELADTPGEQARGLMYRTGLEPDGGMIFPFPFPRNATLWMKNTVIPLDIIFIGPDRRILNIAADTVPYSLDSVISEGTAGAVLELNGGRAAQLGITAGDRVEW